MSVGGMATKLEAAQKAGASGIPDGDRERARARHPAPPAQGRAAGDALPAARRPARRAQALDRLRGAAAGAAHG